VFKFKTIKPNLVSNSADGQKILEYVELLKMEIEKSFFGIEESGSNANGNYVKFSDGTLVCYSPRFDLSGVSISAFAEGVTGYGHNKNWTFPVPFYKNTNPAVTASCEVGGWGINVATCEFSYPDYATITIMATWANAGTVWNSAFMQAMAIGRWKE
jgi:hypothetical protein